MINKIKNFFYWIVKSCQYAWFLRNDFDWDYCYIFRLLQYKLARTRRRIVEDGVTSSTHRIEKQIKYAEFLIEKILNDKYAEKEYEQHDVKWGELNILRKKFGESELSTCIFHRPNIITKEDKEQEFAEFKAIMELEIKRKQDTYNRLWRHLDKYIQNWWD